MLRKIFITFFALFFILILSSISYAGVKKTVAFIALKKTVPVLIKNYGKKTVHFTESKIINYIKNNPNSKKKFIAVIDEHIKKHPLDIKNANLLKSKLELVAPNLAKISMKLPKNGKWKGDAGNSIFYPNKMPDNSKYKLSDLQKITGKDGIPFKNGYPDFEKFRNLNVPVKGMNGNHKNDVDLTIKELINSKKFVDKKEVMNYVNKNDLIFHHEPDGKSMSLVKRIIHDSVRHEGGASFLRNN